MSAEEQMNAALHVFFAAIKDAGINREMTQFKMLVKDKNDREFFARVIVVPETMDMEWSKPLEKKL